VREVSEEAQSGKTSKELVKFSQTEPDAAVFRPPISYVIVNREVNADPCLSFGKWNPLLPLVCSSLAARAVEAASRLH